MRIVRVPQGDKRILGPLEKAWQLPDEQDVPTALFNLVQAGIEKERKGMQEKLQTEVKKRVDAAVAAELAKRSATAPRPERTALGTSGPGITDQQFLEEFNAGKRNSPDDFKRALGITTSLGDGKLIP